MSIVSYAQNFEDVLLWRALSDVQQGRYIDIGAHDPIIDSVSQAFYDVGWRGLHVEPIPFYAARLREARPEEAVIQAAVTDEEGPILFYELGGLSSGRNDIAEHHARCGHAARQMFVPAVRLEQLLKAIDDEVHWLKIDVEGMEADVLRSWGDCDVRPWILVVEATFPNSQEPTRHLWIDEVLKRGYEQVFFDGLSCYFVHEAHRELCDRLVAPANVFDKFAITIDHFSAVNLRAELEAIEQRLGGAQAQVELLAAKLSASEEQLGGAHAQVDLLDAKLSASEEQLSHEKIRVEELSANLAHASAVEKAYLEAQKSSTEVNEELRRALSHSETAFSDSRVDAARLEERCAQLQGRLDRADEARHQAEAKRGELEQLVTELRATHEQARVDFEQRLAAAAEDRIQAQVRGEQFRGDLDRLTQLARAAVAAPSGRWQRLGETLGFTRPASVLEALAFWLARSAAGGEPPPSDNQISAEGSISKMHISAPTQARNPYLRANSLSELLSWEDVDFVRCAYVTILGRQPDPDGEAYYTRRIRDGHSKLQVLRQLRKSEEGPDHDPGIAGLDRALNRAHRARYPLWGPIYRILTGVEDDDSRTTRRHRAVLNELAMLRAEQRRIAAVEESLGKIDRTVSLVALRFGSVQSPRTSSSQAHEPLSQLVLERSLVDPIDMSAAGNAREIIDCLSTAVNASREVGMLARS